MLAALINVPENDAEWARWSFNNQDAVSQIVDAIKTQKGITLPIYQLDPINFADVATFLNNNQQAHTAFTQVTGTQSSDLLDVDLHDPEQRLNWVYLNYQELNSACQVLKIGP
jgi:hypothetical protein